VSPAFGAASCCLSSSIEKGLRCSAQIPCNAQKKASLAISFFIMSLVTPFKESCSFSDYIVIRATSASFNLQALLTSFTQTYFGDAEQLMFGLDKNQRSS